MPKIIFLKGLPASGKSTWAKDQIANGNYMRISKDDIRNNMLGPWNNRKEKHVVRIRNELIRLGIKLGKNIIIDDTNLNPTHERTIKNLAKELGADFEINDSFLEVSPEECIKRDLERQKSVGAGTIWQMYYQYICPNKVKLLDEKWAKRRCVIVDIDGTLAHNLSGRNIYDLSKVKDDTPDPFVTCLVDSISETYSYYVDVIIVSGREDISRKVTEEWLENNTIPYTKMYMRKEGDKRDDTIVKEEIYHQYIEPNYAVLGVFDDRPKVCRMWRKLGLNVAQMGNPYIEF